MTATGHPGVGTTTGGGWRADLPVATLIIIALPVLVGVGMSFGASARYAVLVTGALGAVGLGLRSPRALLYCLIIWFSVLGTLRRLLDMLGEAPGVGDPLLGVAFVAIMTLCLVARAHTRPLPMTSLAHWVVFLQIVLLMSTFNPLQGSPLVAVGGLFLVFTPTFGFWIGRMLADDRTVETVTRMFVLIVVAVAIYGLYQTYGTPPWYDLAWADRVQGDYAALSVGGHVRAFASFSSASEYTQVLGVGLVALLVWAKGFNLYVIGAALPLALAALWLGGSRGALVLAVLALGGIMAARLGMRPALVLAVGLVTLVALPAIVGAIAPANFSGDRAGAGAERQTEGLSNPFGEGSTLPVHVEMVVDGVTSAIHNPIGSGLGVVTNAASKYATASADTRNTEADPSNMAVAAGAAGLVTWFVIAWKSLTTGFRQARVLRTRAALFTFGVLIVGFLQWLSGGNYSTPFLVWFAMGAIDRRTAQALLAARRNRTEAAAPPAAP